MLISFFLLGCESPMTLVEGAQICLYEKREIGTWIDLTNECQRIGGQLYIARKAKDINLAFKLLDINGRFEEENTDYDLRYFTGEVMHDNFLSTYLAMQKSMNSNIQHLSSDHNKKSVKELFHL